MLSTEELGSQRALWEGMGLSPSVSPRLESQENVTDSDMSPSHFFPHECRVLGSMVDGIMARVGDHSEVETLAKESNVPVINALSSLWHPTQTLASLLTLARIYKDRKPSSTAALAASAPGKSVKESWSTLLHQDKTAATADDKPKIPGQPGTKTNPLECLKGLKVAWVGDCNNVVNDMIVTYPRLGIDLRVACPGGKDGEYGLDPRVWAKLCVLLHFSLLSRRSYGLAAVPDC